MFEHSADCANANGGRDVMEMPLPNEMHCVCGFSTAIGNKMAHHLAKCRQKSAYPTLEMALENTVKRNMLDMLGLVRRDGETSTEGDEMAAGGSSAEAADADADADAADDQNDNSDANDLAEQLGMAAEAEQQQPEQSEEHSVAPLNEQPPIPFGEMEAAPVVAAASAAQQEPVYDNIDDANMQSHQYHNIGYQPTLNADIDMPLIGELADPNPPPTPQFLGEVHTPMFDPAAAAEQQHYQMLQQQQQQQHHGHHHHQ